MSDDLVSRLREPLSQLSGDDDALMERVVSDRDEAATALEEARAEIERLRASVTRLTANPADHRYWEGRWRDADRELSTLRDMLVLCGELGGMGKDETPAAYLRRLIDEVAGVESLRALVREVVGPFGNLAQRYNDTVSDGWIPWIEFITNHEWPSELDCRAARQLMEEVK